MREEGKEGAKEGPAVFSEVFFCRCRRHLVKDEKLIACERITFLRRLLLLGYRERWKPIPLANQASRLSKSKKQ